MSVSGREAGASEVFPPKNFQTFFTKFQQYHSYQKALVLFLMP